MSKYDIIINLPHYEPKNHPRMDTINRAAQFAPYSALTGYEEAVVETARLTNKKIDIDDGLREIINRKLNIINNHLKDHLCINITYFIKDKTKDGGEYKTIPFNVKKIDINNQVVISTNNIKIKFDDILNITSDNLNLMVE